MQLESYKRLFAEGILIVFSVLFALFINQMAEDYQTDQRRKIALSSVQKELEQNQTRVKR